MREKAHHGRRAQERRGALHGRKPCGALRGAGIRHACSSYESTGQITHHAARCRARAPPLPTLSVEKQGAKQTLVECLSSVNDEKRDPESTTERFHAREFTGEIVRPSAVF